MNRGEGFISLRKEYERQLDSFALSIALLTTNVRSLTSGFGMGPGVSNLLWPSSFFEDFYAL